MLAVVVVEGLHLTVGILLGALVALAVVVMGGNLVMDQQQQCQLAEEVEVQVVDLLILEATVVPVS
jgi:hypothetical protein